MAEATPPIARIRLARSRWRTDRLPILLLVLAAVVVAATLLGPFEPGSVAWFVLLVAAAVLAVVAAFLLAWSRSVRLDVEEDAIHVRWLGGGRVYRLTPGPVTRVRLRGENASSLRARSAWVGWEVGRARLRGEEDIEVVRLGRTPTAILVPTQRGRLAIAPASEEQLIAALTEAAHARRRTEEAALDRPEPETAAAVEAGATEPEPRPVPADVEAYGSVAHVLTGIERAEMEERLARERAAAASLPPAPAEPVPDSDEAATVAVPSAPEPRRRWLGARATARLGRPRPSAAFVLVPLVGSGAVWGIASALGRLPDPTTDLGRLTALALVLAGPATSVGAIMARAWWPRLVGVVVTSGLAATVFVGRALLG